MLVCVGMALQELMNSAPSSASAADDMTDFIICAMVNTARYQLYHEMSSV